MANVLGELFSDIANAIREKTGDTATMNPNEFPSKISAIEGDSQIVDGVDPYYQKLAEALMKRQAAYLSGDNKTMSMKNFVTSDGSTLASLNPYSFAGFNYVEGMEFTDVVMVQSNAFTGNSKLKILDITTAKDITLTSFYPNSLSGCTALEAIIIRNGEAGLSSANVNSSNGANDTFYIYVPAAYYDTVIANITDGFLPASRYRKLEEYPEIDNWNKTYTVEFYDGDTLVDTKTVKYGQTAATAYTKEGMQLVAWTPSPENVTQNLKCYGEWVMTFAATPWETIVEKAADGTAAEIWSVGDSKDLVLNYADGTSEAVTLKIAGFNAGLAEDGTPFHMYFATTQALKDSWPLYTKSMGYSITQDKYQAMDMSQHLDNDIYPAMPDALRNAIRGKQNYHSYIPVRKLWNFSNYEVDKPAFTNSKLTFVNEIFPDNASRQICKRGATTPIEWWLGELSVYGASVYGTGYSTSGTLIRGQTSAGSANVVPECPANGTRGVVFGFGI